MYDIFILMYMYSQCLVMCIWKSCGMIAYFFLSENHLVNYEFYIRVLLKIAICNFLQKIYEKSKFIRNHLSHTDFNEFFKWYE